MIDLNRLQSDIEEIDETIKSAIFNLQDGEKSKFSERAGISRQALYAYMAGKADFSLKRKIEIYKRIRTYDI